ncbi:hypothetical protein TCON_0711 [Astathelohania contejeani]|uniref:Uncharacterized protein n=1 Tax=Astathelohania contejeani TaxID=164912 RepID=A0ABQ7I0X9_9MICR|nr:hypothetical protein TCON_0711 [Thelohania contejeani]
MKMALKQEAIITIAMAITSIIFAFYTGLVYYKSVPKGEHSYNHQTNTYYYALDAGKSISISKTEFYSSHMDISIFNISPKIFYVVLNSSKIFAFERERFMEVFETKDKMRPTNDQLTLVIIKFVELCSVFPYQILSFKRIGDNLTVNGYQLKNEQNNISRFITRLYECSDYDK